jgi:hypothetical protein
MAEWRVRKQIELQHLRKSAWRPKDFGKWPTDQQVIGALIIANPELTPREMGQRLDNSTSPIRPPERWKIGNLSWETAFTTPGAGAMFFSRVRRRLRDSGLSGF